MFLKYLLLATEKNKMKSTSLYKSEEIVQVIKRKKDTREEKITQLCVIVIYRRHFIELDMQQPTTHKY